MMYSKDVHCSTPECEHAAEYKIAAPWSYGSFAELKTYGLACADHKNQLFHAAVERGKSHSPSPDEKIGPIALYHYEKGKHDRDLERVG